MFKTHIMVGDVLRRLRELGDGSVQCVVTSPPYWGLRDYGTGTWKGGNPRCDHIERTAAAAHKSSTLGSMGKGSRGKVHPPTNAAFMSQERQYLEECGKCGAVREDEQIGLESTPEGYVVNLVDVFAEVRRVLRDDGTLWLNLGDTYSSGAMTGKQGPNAAFHSKAHHANKLSPRRMKTLPPKNLVGIPWRVAFALQQDGWILRRDVIWHKPNPMPESTSDRCTGAHEYIFHFSKSPRYYYDAEAIKEEGSGRDWAASGGNIAGSGIHKHKDGFRDAGGRYEGQSRTGANRRDVWTITTKPYAEAHFATFPPELPAMCIKAGTSEMGACVACRTPWVRVVERGSSYNQGRLAPGKSAQGPYAAQAGGKDEEHDVRRGVTVSSRTVGWEPGCDCVQGHDSADPYDEEPCCIVPCVVLDPFGGSGTTAIVANKLKRNAILIELNPEYAEMAARRIGYEGGLLSRVSMSTKPQPRRPRARSRERLTLDD